MAPPADNGPDKNRRADGAHVRHANGDQAELRGSRFCYNYRGSEERVAKQRDEANRVRSVAAVSERKISELRRSVFVPHLPDRVSGEELADYFRNIGCIQEIFVKRSGSSGQRYSIVIFVEEASAFDALHAGLTLHSLPLPMEPRKVADVAYPPRVPRDTPTPLIVQCAAGGRGIPYSVIPAGIPLLSEEEAYRHHCTGLPKGPVTTRAPLLKSWTALVEKKKLEEEKRMAVAVIEGNGCGMRWTGKKGTVRERMGFLGTSEDPCEQMRLLMEYSQLSVEERDCREQLRRQLEASFRRIFHKCSLRLYGSSVNTFGVRGSDIDSFLELYLDETVVQTEAGEKTVRDKPVEYYFNNMTHLFPCPYRPAELAPLTPQEILRLMEKLVRYVGKSQNWTEVLSIPYARTPILKLHHGPTNLSVDVSFSSKLVFENTGLLILYSHLDRRVRPLVFTLRHWAELKGLTGQDGFSKYALTLLLVFFLHTTEPPVLPPPDEVARLVQASDDLHGFRTADGGFSFDLPEKQLIELARRLPKSTNAKSEADLLVDLLDYLSIFPFHDTVMDGWNGEVLPVDAFRSDLSPDLESFKLRYINLQDPFDRAHNITKNITLPMFLSFLQRVAEEACIFRRRALNIIDLLETQREDEVPPAPVVMTLSTPSATAEFEVWAPQVGGLLKRMLEGFFRCECVEETSETSSAPIWRFVRIGSVLAQLACRLQHRTWQQRRNVRRALVKKRASGLLGLEDEWAVECQVGGRLAEGGAPRGAAVDLAFGVTVLRNEVEAQRLSVFLAAPHTSPDIADLFEFLVRFLPEQVRRFLRLGQSGSTELADGQDAPTDTL